MVINLLLSLQVQERRVQVTLLWQLHRFFGRQGETSFWFHFSLCWIEKNTTAKWSLSWRTDVPMKLSHDLRSVESSVTWTLVNYCSGAQALESGVFRDLVILIISCKMYSVSFRKHLLHFAPNFRANFAESGKTFWRVHMKVKWFPHWSSFDSLWTPWTLKVQEKVKKWEGD